MTGAPTSGDAGVARRLAEIATGRRAVDHEVLTGGFRHTMVRVACDGGRDVVARLSRGTPGAMAIEAEVLRRAATVVAVPEVVLSDPDGDHTGVPGLVLSHVAGTRADVVLARATAPEAHRIGELLGATAAALPGVRFPRPGLFADADLRPDDGGRTLSELVVSYTELGLEAVPDTLLAARSKHRWRSMVAAAAPGVDRLGHHSVLVHADLNPKNVMLRRDGDRWALAALLDWEFAMSGTALIDLGNLQRFAGNLPAGYATAIGRGHVRAGGRLPADWRHLAATLDTIALGEMLSRGPAAPLRDDVIDLIDRATRRGTLVPTDW